MVDEGIMRFQREGVLWGIAAWGGAPGYGIYVLRTMDWFSFPEDASHGERLAGMEIANTEIGVPGGC